MHKRILRLTAVAVLLAAGVLGMIQLSATPAEARPGGGCLNACYASGGSWAYCRSNCMNF